MKITCTVDVVNRLLPSLSMPGKKSVKSSLVIGKASDKEICILHQTNENAQGRKYKIKDNIANVFVKFVNEGKTTIRFKVPEHDLAIKCDPIQLKGFLRTLKLVMEGQPLPKLSAMQPNTLLKPIKSVKKNMKIVSKADYPVLEGFPRTLESLHINGLNQKLLDNRILRLRNLCCLNLEDNDLTTLPEQLGSSLPNLAELYLSKNRLGLSRDFRWIVNRKLQENLKLLDLRSNQINYLPDKSVYLKRLVTLKLDCNNLESLPNGIGCMTSLRYLHISNNPIGVLPGSIISLNLEYIDMSNIIRNGNRHFSDLKSKAVPSLVDLASIVVIQHRLPYSSDVLPLTVMDHLNSISYCFCGRPTYTCRSEFMLKFSHFSKATELVTSDNYVLRVALRMCDTCRKMIHPTGKWQWKRQTKS